MSRTVLQIAQNAIVLAGFDSPKSLLSPSQHYDIGHYRAVLESVGKELASKYSWPSLIKTYTFITISGQDSYSLPGDCAAIVPNTAYDGSAINWMEGPLSLEDFALEQFYPIAAGVTYKFASQGFNRIVITPTPTEAISLSMKYKSKNWLLPPIWTTEESISAGEYRQYLDNVYVAVSAGVTGTTPPTHITGDATDGGVSWSYYDNEYVDILSDSDIPVIDVLALEAGMISRIKETLEQPNQVDELRYTLRGSAGFAEKNIGKTISLFGNRRFRRNPKIVDF